MTQLQAYSYVRELREHNAPRSRATRFLEAVAVSFAFHVLGAEVGTTVPLVVPKKKTRLTVAQVRFLEQVALSGHGQESRGHLLRLRLHGTSHEAQMVGWPVLPD